MLKTQKGITLIALVVTIVVLLILAGVTISLLLDENGIIAKSKDARIETRASQVEDEVGMWKQHNFINKESNQAQESADTMLASLISRKLLTEDEIDREQELITIKKKDGTVIKEISYSSVTINISKSPENKKSGYVELTVESVEGMTIPIITNEKELNDFFNSLSKEQKKDIIKRSLPTWVNNRDSSANCMTFEQALEYFKNKNWIEEATEEFFWNDIESKGGIDRFLGEILVNLYLDRVTGKINGYIVTNPDNNESNTYTAMDNGTYAFKVKDLITGKTYTKKVEVTNILVVEPENIGNWEYTEEDDGKITITGYKGTDTTVVVPNRINGKAVRKIGSGHHSGGNNYSYSIWNEKICSQKYLYFYQQNTIKEIIISGGIEIIGEFAFAHTEALTKVTIPNSVYEIERGAFCGCDSLSVVTIPEKLDTIATEVFFGCESLTDIVIPDNITTISNEAFGRCTNLSQITIPHSVENIGDYAFKYCVNLSNIIIPSGVTTMGSGVFRYIPSITVNVPFKEGEQPSGWDANWNQTNSDCTITVNYAK